MLCRIILEQIVIFVWTQFLSLNQGNKNILETKLDEYIHKYYINQSVGGFLLGLVLVLLYVLLALMLEFFGHFGSMVRLILFLLFAWGSSLPHLEHWRGPVFLPARATATAGTADASAVVAKAAAAAYQRGRAAEEWRQHAHAGQELRRRHRIVRDARAVVWIFVCWGFVALTSRAQVRQGHRPCRW